jgi:hypothetical protein
MAALSPLADARFKEARGEGRREPEQAYRFDALVDLAQWAMAHMGPGPGEADAKAKAKANGGGAGARRRGASAKVLIRVELDALVRRQVASEEELCELVGFGPVPVSSVREITVRDRPFLAAVLPKAKAVMGVAHLGRRLSAHQLTALQWSMPTCSVAGCGQTARLEYDHRKDWAKTHETSLEGTDPLCHHHVVKT